MTPAERYKQALAQITPPNSGTQAARSLREIEGATNKRIGGKMGNQPITATGLNGESRRVQGRTKP